MDEDDHVRRRILDVVATRAQMTIMSLGDLPNGACPSLNVSATPNAVPPSSPSSGPSPWSPCASLAAAARNSAGLLDQLSLVPPAAGKASR